MTEELVQSKSWYTSKTKWAGIVGGLLIFANTVPAWLNGAVFPLEQFLTAAMVVLGVFGLRDLPIVNKVQS